MVFSQRKAYIVLTFDNHFFNGEIIGVGEDYILLRLNRDMGAFSEGDEVAVAIDNILAATEREQVGQ